MFPKTVRTKKTVLYFTQIDKDKSKSYIPYFLLSNKALSFLYFKYREIPFITNFGEKTHLDYHCRLFPAGNPAFQVQTRFRQHITITFKYNLDMHPMQEKKHCNSLIFKCQQSKCIEKIIRQETLLVLLLHFVCKVQQLKSVSFTR